MSKLVAAADHKGVEGVARIELGGAIPVKAALRRAGGGGRGGKSAIVPHCGCRWIVLRGHKLDIVEAQAQIVDGFLDQVGVLVARVAELNRWNPHEQNSPAGVAV